MGRATRSVVAALVLAACANSHLTRANDVAAPTPCHVVIPECNVPRLPDKTLTGNETDGALRSTDDFDLSGILSFDEALKLGWHESPRADATSVHVLLGSANVWAPAAKLYYVIRWTGVCTPVYGGFGQNDGPQSPQPCNGTFGSAFDAHTGAFIVDG